MHAYLVGQQLLERRKRACYIPRLSPERGEVVPGEEGVGVVWALHM